MNFGSEDPITNKNKINHNLKNIYIMLCTTETKKLFINKYIYIYKVSSTNCESMLISDAQIIHSD